MRVQINKGIYWNKYFKQIQILPNLTFTSINDFCIVLDWLVWYIELRFTNKIEENEDTFDETNS